VRGRPGRVREISRVAVGRRPAAVSWRAAAVSRRGTAVSRGEAAVWRPGGWAGPVGDPPRIPAALAVQYHQLGTATGPAAWRRNAVAMSPAHSLSSKVVFPRFRGSPESVDTSI
jgi:hypothetical protein